MSTKKMSYNGLTEGCAAEILDVSNNRLLRRHDGKLGQIVQIVALSTSYERENGHCDILINGKRVNGFYCRRFAKIAMTYEDYLFVFGET